MQEVIENLTLNEESLVKPNLALVKADQLLTELNQKDPFVLLGNEELKTYDFALDYLTRDLSKADSEFLKVFRKMFTANRFNYVRGEQMQVRTSYLNKLEEITGIKHNSKKLRRYLKSYTSLRNYSGLKSPR